MGHACGPRDPCLSTGHVIVIVTSRYLLWRHWKRCSLTNLKSTRSIVSSSVQSTPFVTLRARYWGSIVARCRQTLPDCRYRNGICWSPWRRGLPPTWTLGNMWCRVEMSRHISRLCHHKRTLHWKSPSESVNVHLLILNMGLIEGGNKLLPTGA